MAKSYAENFVFKPHSCLPSPVSCLPSPVSSKVLTNQNIIYISFCEKARALKKFRSVSVCAKNDDFGHLPDFQRFMISATFYISQTDQPPHPFDQENSTFQSKTFHSTGNKCKDSF